MRTIRGILRKKAAALRALLLLMIWTTCGVFAYPERAEAICLWSCTPTERNGADVFLHMVQSRFGMPVSVVLTKTNGASQTMQGMSIYEMQFTAEVDFPQGIVGNPGGNTFAQINAGAQGNMKMAEIQELGNVTVKKIGQKFWEPMSFSIAGTLTFQKTENGWQGQDGRVY